MTTATKTIGTHNGKFHADEALACHLLTILFPDAVVTRTRDPAILTDMDIVVDVGGVYDAASHRYDHHQREFTDTFDSKNFDKIRLSSAGLVYRHFGRQILKEKYQNLSDAEVDIFYEKVYKSFIMPLDAIDNGIDPFPAECGEPLYRDGTGLASRIDRLNPDWNDHVTDPDLQFQKAMDMAGLEFTEQCAQIVNSWFPARSIVEKAFKARWEVDKSGKIIVLETFAPWKSHIYSLEQEEAGSTEDHSIALTHQPCYVLYPDSGKSWRIQAVPINENSFQNRAPLPAPWRGLRDAELCTLTGIENCVFVHASGFIGGNKTKEGVIKMAKLALQLLK